MDKQKDMYSCFECGYCIITIQEDEGTVPRIIPCVNGICDGVMRSHFNNKLDTTGQKPTHKLIHKKESLSDKLSVVEIEKVEA